MKTNIAPLENALDTIQKLRGVTYEWKQEAAPKATGIGKPHIGFIAQEVEQVLPQLVTRNDKDLLHMDYTAVIPILVEAIKQQQRRIDALAANLTPTS